MSDLIFANGRLFDGLKYHHDHAVGVRGSRIYAVGPLDRVREEMAAGGRRAEEVDAGGGLVMPAFHDAHIHPLIGGLELRSALLTDCTGAEACLEKIADCVAEQGDVGDRWFRGGGWSLDDFDASTGPTAEMLDRVVPHRPAFLPSNDHHNAWVNTRALELAGIDRDTPDPPDGWIERDADGNPTGTLREAAALLVHRLVDTTREEKHAALRDAEAHLHSWGIVGWQDALVGGYAGIDDPTQAYLDLVEADELTARVRLALWWDRNRGVEQIEELEAERARLGEAGLDAGSVKLMVDGVSETLTMAVDEPYLGGARCPCAGGERGLAFMEPEQLDEAVCALDAAGFQAHFHALGDRAVRTSLDAIEAARRRHGWSNQRHQLAHLQLVAPVDRNRFRLLGAIANVEGMWARYNTPAVQMVKPYLDDERLDWQYPFADIVDSGALVAGGSDWPINPPDPMEGIHVLVNRSSRSTDESDEEPPMRDDQGLTLLQALQAYTSGAAHANHQEDSGNLRVGASADVLVLDRDPFDLHEDEIGSAEPVTAWARGSEVYRRD
ncbi:amidohydrolase [Nocardioides sp. SOB44]|uniref:Amidohydrolase n=1 Tax=Nocardioides cremeus TaxID=3058044 RepID=A0ABT8TQC9_9ACTN|nr:amidohydrolase [Nocardioides cremeus]MDO3395208.1 amidohydrolase [Nocardioides cremeus]